MRWTINRTLRLCAHVRVLQVLEIARDRWHWCGDGAVGPRAAPAKATNGKETTCCAERLRRQHAPEKRQNAGRGERARAGDRQVTERVAGTFPSIFMP
jgi:hypothetical protein